MASKMDAVLKVAKRYNGGVHGDDANGIWDIEFPTVMSAASFHWAVAREVCVLHGAKFREPVSDFTQSVVVQIDSTKL